MAHVIIGINAAVTRWLRRRAERLRWALFNARARRIRESVRKNGGGHRDSTLDVRADRDR